MYNFTVGRFTGTQLGLGNRTAVRPGTVKRPLSTLLVMRNPQEPGKKKVIKVSEFNSYLEHCLRPFQRHSWEDVESCGPDRYIT